MKTVVYKYHGAGNDFIIIDRRESKIELSAKQITLLCDRHFGIGADGLMFLQESKEYPFGMTYYNADGNESTMCGNGGRCMVAFAARLGIKCDEFEAIDGIHRAKMIEYGEKHSIVKIEMIPVTHVREYSPKSYFLNTGSPHLVIFVDDIENFDVSGQGKLWRNHPSFPGGTNVDFVQGNWGRHATVRTIENRPVKLKVRSYERGVEDETLACGTGAVAASIAHYKMAQSLRFYQPANNLKSSPQTISTEIEMLGGDLSVQFTHSGDNSYTNIHLTGPTVFVFKCEIEL